MAGTPKDHYVPQCYLDAFACEGSNTKNPHIYQYLPDKIVSPSIADVASERHFHTFKGKDGTPNRDLEALFGLIESEAANPLKNLVSSKCLPTNDRDRERLSIFFAMLATRTPGHIKSMQSIHTEGLKELMALEMADKDKFRKECEEMGITMTEEELDKQHRMVTEKKYEFDYSDSRGHFMAQGLKLATDQLAEIIYEKKSWHLLVINSPSVFITSDNPVTIFRPSWVPKIRNAGYSNGTIIIAISPKVAILFRDTPLDDLVININEHEIKEINKNIMAFSDCFIFSNLKSKRFHRMYRIIGGKHFQKTMAVRAKNAPYTFFMTSPVPEEIITNKID
jgi:hypothetical protein